MANDQKFMVVNGGTDEGQLLGKFIYYSLSNVLVEKDDVERICNAMNFPYSGRRISVVDAFRNATGSVTRRIIAPNNGMQQIYRIYCRDNQRDGSLYSRELVRETVDQHTNRYEKLANICYEKDMDHMYYSIVQGDPMVDISELCDEMIQRFGVYRRCFGRSQIDTMLLHYLESLDALPISVYGKLYFIPRHSMHKADLFEDFLDELQKANRHEKPLMVNSFFVADDTKQREKMSAEFYALVRREAQEYQERAEHLLSTDCQSPSILERWVLRIEELEQKKQRFEALFQKELNETEEEFGALQLFSQELQIRALSIRTQKAA